MQSQFNINVGDEIVLTPESYTHTLVWLHGMGEQPQKALDLLLHRDLLGVLRGFRIVLPRAPKRYIKLLKNTLNAWFDFKMRGQLSFVVDTNDAFEEAHIHESFNKILKPILQRESALLQNRRGAIFLGGFSQGCAMAYHCLYNTEVQLGGVFGVSGYMFKVTRFTKENKTPKKLVFGLQDKTREWAHTKICFEGKFQLEEIIFVEGMGHQLNRTRVREQMIKFFKGLLTQKRAKL